jgi:hypothetical protein
MKKPQRGRMFFDDAEFRQLINACRLPNRRHPAKNCQRRRQREEYNDFDNIEVPGGFCSSAGGGLTKSWITKSFFGWGGAR